MASPKDVEDSSSILMRFMEVFSTLSTPVQIMLLICIVLLATIFAKSSYFNSFLKYFGIKTSESESKTEESKQPRIEARTDITMVSQALHELSQQINNLTKAIENLQISITDNQDQIAGVMSHTITTLADLAAELRKARLYPESKS